MKKPELDRRKLATETLKSTAGSPGWERGIEVAWGMCLCTGFCCCDPKSQEGVLCTDILHVGFVSILGIAIMI